MAVELNKSGKERLHIVAKFSLSQFSPDKTNT